MLPQTSETDVLIVGAGPTGLALGAELNRFGVRPMIVDRQAAGANTSRAAVIHARTLEVLEGLGATRDLLAEGVKVPLFRIRDRDHALIKIDFANIPSKYRFTLMCPQDRTERILANHLKRLGGNVKRPVELIDFDEGDGRVVVRLAEGDEVRTVSTRWLVGCDGGHSRVREQAGIAFTGASYAQAFVLADVHMDWPLSRKEVCLFFSPEGLIVVAALPEDRFRIVATVDEAPEVPPPAFMQELLDRRGPSGNRAQIRDLVWSSRFHIHHRVADSPRKRRVLLCGDAAHVHSPAGGQGMNTGIQDAVSLAEILADTVKGGDPAQLDAWAAKRQRVAEEVVAMTDRMTRVATMRSGLCKTVRNAAISFAGHIPPVRAAIARKLAELDAR